MSGWIKISRCIVEHWIFEDNQKLKWWLSMIINVNYKDSKFLLGNNVYDIKRGSSTNSIRRWAIIFNTGTKSVMAFFELLEKEGMITKEVIGKGKQSTTLINITNYSKHQDKEETLEGTLKGTQKKHKGVREGHTEEEGKEGEENKELHPLQKYVVENLPRVSKLKKQLSFENCEELIKKYPKQKIYDTLVAMENYNKLNYVSVYLTVLNWLKKEEERNPTPPPKKELKEIPASEIFSFVKIDYGNYPHNED